MTDDTEPAIDFETELLMKNRSIPSIEKKEHHYTEEYPDHTHVDELQLQRESM
jgi:hypothetical protein